MLQTNPKYHESLSFELGLVTEQLFFPTVECSQLRFAARITASILSFAYEIFHSLPFDLQGFIHMRSM